MELHPDRGGTANEARFKLVSVAYAHLSDPALKASYDASSQPRVYTSVKPPLNRMQRSTSEMCPTRYEVAPEGSVMQQQLLRRYTSRWQSPSKTHSAPTPPKNPTTETFRAPSPTVVLAQSRLWRGESPMRTPRDHSRGRSPGAVRSPTDSNTFRSPTHSNTFGRPPRQPSPSPSGRSESALRRPSGSALRRPSWSVQQRQSRRSASASMPTPRRRLEADPQSQPTAQRSMPKSPRRRGNSYRSSQSIPVPRPRDPEAMGGPSQRSSQPKVPPLALRRTSRDDATGGPSYRSSQTSHVPPQPHRAAAEPSLRSSESNPVLRCATQEDGGAVTGLRRSSQSHTVPRRGAVTKTMATPRGADPPPKVTRGRHVTRRKSYNAPIPRRPFV